MENKKSNKGLIIALICGIIVILILIGIIIGMAMNNNDDEDDDYTPKSKENSSIFWENINKDEDVKSKEEVSKNKDEENIRKVLEKFGKYFYEEYYYDSIETQKNKFLSRYSTIGIKIDLNNLNRLSQSILSKKELEYFDKALQVCDSTSTKVVIYPKGDFGKADYDMEVIMECDL